MSMCELGTICQEHAERKNHPHAKRPPWHGNGVQDRLYGGRHCRYGLDGNPDFVKLAEAYGIRRRLCGLQREAKVWPPKMLRTKGPYLLVCTVDPSTPSI